MISQTAEYALRAAVCLASSPDVPLTTRQISARAKVPAGYLSKVLQAMGRAGIVDSTRGLGGGFSLGPRPDRLTLYRIINAVDPLQRIRRCPLGIRSHRRHLCPLHRRLDEAMASVERAFRQTTVAELLANPGVLPLSEGPGLRKP